MPTNILRNRVKPVTPAPAAAHARAVRRIAIRAGRVTVRAELLDTPTARRIAAALPIHSTAETWGDSIHFDVPVESGRERGARANAVLGDINFWAADGRVIIGFGATPISRPGEIRLPQPCNVWARAIDDVTVLKSVRPGEKVLVAAEAA